MKRTRSTLADTILSKEAAYLLNVDERTLRRWRGKHLNPTPDPLDPRRLVYERREVEELAEQRRLQLLPVLRARALVRRPQIPGQKVSEGFAMLRQGHNEAHVCERLELSLEEGELLAEKFRKWGGVKKAHQPRAVPSAAREESPAIERDLEMEEWERSLDEEKGRWADSEDGPSTDEDDDDPSSSRVA